MATDYLSEVFVKAGNPYDTRDKCKLIQPLKRTTTYGLRYFEYYGAHVWNMLSINIKAAQSLYEFKSFIKSWPGPTCSCQICTALLYEMSPNPPSIIVLRYYLVFYFTLFLFPCISFQILFLWILFLMWAIYMYHCFHHFISMYFYMYVLCIIISCIFIYLSIYWKSGTSDLMVLMLFVTQCTDYK